MKTGAPFPCLAESPLLDPEFVLMTVVLLLVLTVGGLAILAACRWYRTLEQPPATGGAEAAEFVQSLEEEDELDAEELARVRAALDKQRESERASASGDDTTAR